MQSTNEPKSRAAANPAIYETQKQKTGHSDSRNSKTLASFIEYCNAHPHERFWQALRNWAGFNFICVRDAAPWDGWVGNCRDTFNWEGRNG